MTSLTANQNSNCNQSSEAIVERVLTDTGTDTGKSNIEATRRASVAQNPKAGLEWAEGFSLSTELVSLQLAYLEWSNWGKAKRTPLKCLSCLCRHFCFHALKDSFKLLKYEIASVKTWISTSNVLEEMKANNGTEKNNNLGVTCLYMIPWKASPVTLSRSGPKWLKSVCHHQNTAEILHLNLPNTTRRNMLFKVQLMASINLAGTKHTQRKYVRRVAWESA